MPAKREQDELPPPVECKNCGHFNDPYPENGLCVECSKFLKGNPHALQSSDMPDVHNRQNTRRRAIKNRAKQYVEEAGLKWSTVGALTQDLAVRAATTHDRHDSTLLAEQLEIRKPRPQSGEAPDITNIDIHISDELADSLRDLKEIEISRDRPSDVS